MHTHIHNIKYFTYLHNAGIPSEHQFPIRYTGDKYTSDW